MKTKILLISFIILAYFSGCKKAEDPKTTYQIVNNCTVTTYAEDSYLDGSLWEVVVSSYVGTDIVKQDNIARVAPAGGKSEIIEVNSNYEKVKVSFKFLPPQSPNYSLAGNIRHYVVAVTLLEKGKNNLITVDDKTQISTSSASAGENSILFIGTVKKSIGELAK